MKYIEYCCYPFPIGAYLNSYRDAINLQGTEDDVVNWFHGNGLWKMAREPYDPLWVKGGGHCNLELYPDYIRHLCRFVQEMENITTQVRLNKIRQTLSLQKRFTSDSKSYDNRCCTIKFRRPKCPECLKPSCVKNCLWPKCSVGKLKCVSSCFKGSCTSCSCWCKKCSCRCTMCSCLCAAKCSCW